MPPVHEVDNKPMQVMKFFSAFQKNFLFRSYKQWLAWERERLPFKLGKTIDQCKNLFMNKNQNSVYGPLNRMVVYVLILFIIALFVMEHHWKKPLGHVGFWTCVAGLSQQTCYALRSMSVDVPLQIML